MAYSFHDENGYLDHGPTTQGLKLVRNAIDAHTATLPALTRFINTGKSSELAQCNNELAVMSHYRLPAPVMHTVTHWIQSFAKAKGFIGLVD